MDISHILTKDIYHDRIFCTKQKSIEYPEKYPALKYDIISCHVPENRIYSGIFYHMIYILYKSGD